MPPIAMNLNAAEHARLQNIAEMKEGVAHLTMRTTLHPYTEEEEEEQTMLRRVDMAEEHFERTGLHITSEDLKGWVAALRLNPHAPLPACHT